MKAEKQLSFHRSLLISLYTLRWTGDHEKFTKMLVFICKYLYAHTDSNPGEEYEPDKIFNQLVENYNKLYYL